MNVAFFPSVDNTNTPVTVVDRFSAAVILNSNGEIVKTSQAKVVRVPADCQLVSGSEDGTLLGPDRKKVSGCILMYTHVIIVFL